MSWRLITQRVVYKKHRFLTLRQHLYESIAYDEVCVVHLVVLFIFVLYTSLFMLLDCQFCTTGEAYLVSYQRVVGCGVRFSWYLFIYVHFLNFVFGRKAWRYQRGNSGPHWHTNVFICLLHIARLGLAQRCVYLLITPCSLGTDTKMCLFAYCPLLAWDWHKDVFICLLPLARLGLAQRCVYLLTVKLIKCCDTSSWPYGVVKVFVVQIVWKKIIMQLFLKDALFSFFKVKSS